MLLDKHPGARRPLYLGLIAALALAAAAAGPLLATPGLVSTRAGGDSPFLLQRLYELQVNLRAGVFPARWMPDAALGLGYPFFNYYASLPYYLAAGLSLAGAGILWALKLTQLLGFLAAAAAMYALIYELLADPAAAFLAAAAYTLAPFHMVNVYVRGDSLSEFYAFVFYPLILWALARLRRAPTAGHLALLALAYAGLMLTHNISALIFSPLAGAALLWAALSAPRRRTLVLLTGGAALVLGAALSAWFWAPALLERDAVSLSEMTTGYFNYSGHFRSRDLVQLAILFDYRIDSEHTPFVAGGLQAALALASVGTLVVSWVRQRRLPWGDLGLLALLACTVWPITPASAWLWAHVPLLPMVQFPWRFLSLVALAVALVAGCALRRLPARPWLAAALALALAVSALALLRPEPLPLSEADVTPERLQLYEQFTGNIGSTVRAEYLPQHAVPRPFASASLLTGQAHPAPYAVAGALSEARLLSAGPVKQVWEVSVSAPKTVLAFETYAFPGWQASVDGRPAAIDPLAANGRITLAVEPGRHQVVLALGPTSLRANAEKLSLFAALLAVGLSLAGLWRARRHWRRLALAAALVLATVGLAWATGTLSRAAQPATPALASETMDFIQQPYLHPNPQGVAFGSTVRLLGYEPLPAEVRAGERVRVRLHWQAVGGEGLRAVLRLTTTAEPLFQAPSLAESTTPLAAVTEHELTVPPEVAPGLALLAVEVQGPGGALTPHTSQGTALGTPYLAPLRVLAPAPTSAAEPLGRLGKAVEVLAGSVQQEGNDRLIVRLTWRPEQPLPEDYVASVRLLDPDGNPVASVDAQPRYGLYPTSLWQPGLPVADYYELVLPPGTPPGPGYGVEAVLYQARTLKPLGAVRIADLTLSQPSLATELHPLYSFAGGLVVTAWSLQRGELHDGEDATARVQWAAAAAPLPVLNARLSLLDSQGKEVAAQLAPLSPRYPPEQWPLHALVNGRLRLTVPIGTPPGRYRLALEAMTADGRSLGRWSPPGTIDVKAAPRQMQLPAFTHPVGADFGGLIRLAGYDLERADGELALTLHWQAIRAPGHDYKVFVHLIDPATDQIVAQCDAPPRGGAYPTGVWAAGEVVSDKMVLDMARVKPGRYPLAVGLYDPETGERLEPVGTGLTVSDRRVLLEEVQWPGE